MYKPERILVPTDFSEDAAQSSKIAIKQAVIMAKDLGSELIFLHVIADEIERKPLFFLDDDKFGLLKEKVAERATQELEKFAKKYIGDLNLKYRIKIRNGVPYDEIIKEEHESGIDCIVIATRGHSALHDFFYGSTTEKVVRRATCNVLVVRKIVDK